MAEVSESAVTQNGSSAVEDEKKCEGGQEKEAIPHLLSTQEEEIEDAPSDKNDAEKGNSPVKKPEDLSEEDALCQSLGIQAISSPESEDETEEPEESQYEIVPNPEADQCDFSGLRGTKAPAVKHETPEKENQEDLQNLAELVPGLRSQQSDSGHDAQDITPAEPAAAAAAPKPSNGLNESIQLGDLTAGESAEVGAVGDNMAAMQYSTQVLPDMNEAKAPMELGDSMFAHEENSVENEEEDKKPEAIPTPRGNGASEGDEDVAADARSSDRLPAGEQSTGTSTVSSVAAHDHDDNENEDQNLGGFEDKASHGNVSESSASSDVALQDDELNDGPDAHHHPGLPPNPEGSGTTFNVPSSASLSTATQTHEVRMPMYLPTFKPATGCTNASDFIVRCFVARLRSGITVVKHGRSRWCKSRLRILHVHADGRSLSWKPAMGEPSSSKRPPKLDLSTCMEVRHAWSPDPLNPMFTGTPILRQKCEAANAHKSFALIFPKRTVDITAVTADQCKVLMEGFSALCFRLHVANLAGRGKKEGSKEGTKDEEASTTASVTLTNNSNTMSPSGSSTAKPSKKGSFRS
eukprot:CAMPEP_0185731208 /NCGR_PEP_ID=MMETSP1171-20130828/12199_1 /TAXON_ID=374046 /ORGANISM="Helicotheca tamensis, Strain CCMP826" /LENGTH=578 /DNA_ID=CAMNT_0028400421 /DNA_START=58 /DNA_END=1794 /DNA_ORIENTATION=+